MSCIIWRHIVTLTYACTDITSDPGFLEKLLHFLTCGDLNSGSDNLENAVDFFVKCKQRLMEGGF